DLARAAWMSSTWMVHPRDGLAMAHASMSSRSHPSGADHSNHPMGDPAVSMRVSAPRQNSRLARMTTEVASPALDAVMMRESLGTSTVGVTAFHASSVSCSLSSSRITVPALLPRPASALRVTTWYLLTHLVLTCSLPDFMDPRD